MLKTHKYLEIKKKKNTFVPNTKYLNLSHFFIDNGNIL